MAIAIAMDTTRKGLRRYGLSTGTQPPGHGRGNSYHDYAGNQGIGFAAYGKWLARGLGQHFVWEVGVTVDLLNVIQLIQKVQ